LMALYCFINGVSFAPVPAMWAKIKEVSCREIYLSGRDCIIKIKCYLLFKC
jgi:hypothetical protein